MITKSDDDPNTANALPPAMDGNTMKIGKDGAVALEGDKIFLGQLNVIGGSSVILEAKHLVVAIAESCP